MGYKVAVVGATGNVGREMLSVLAERLFPYSEVVALASSRSVGTSVSFGRTNGGEVIDPARVPDDGDGFWTPPTWRARGARYGVDELVDLIAADGRKVSAQFPGSRVAIADLSKLSGGGA